MIFLASCQGARTAAQFNEPEDESISARISHQELEATADADRNHSNNTRPGKPTRNPETPAPFYAAIRSTLSCQIRPVRHTTHPRCLGPELSASPDSISPQARRWPPVRSVATPTGLCKRIEDPKNLQRGERWRKVTRDRTALARVIETSFEHFRCQRL